MKSDNKKPDLYRVWISTSGYRDENYKSYLENKVFWLSDQYNISQNYDLSKITSLEEARSILSYYASSHYNFSQVVKKGDYLLLIRRNYYYTKVIGVTLTLCKFVGDYKYLPDGNYHHSRAIEVILENIPMWIFTNRLQGLLRRGFFYRSSKNIDEELIHTIWAYSYFLVKAGRIDEQTFKKVQKIKLTKS